MAVITDTKAKNIKPDDKPIPHGNVRQVCVEQAPDTTTLPPRE